jgi:predicted ATPase with chaperone activity
MRHLAEVVSFVNDPARFAPSPEPMAGPAASDISFSDFGEVRGQTALEVAAAGNHNVLMIGRRGRGRRCSPNASPAFCRR